MRSYEIQEAGHFIIPPPEDAFPVSLETIQTIREIVDGGFGRELLSADLPFKRRDAISDCVDEIYDAVPDLMEQCGDYLRTSRVNLDIDLRSAFPGHTPRFPDWHVDRWYESLRAVILADSLPTEFVHGTIPKGHATAEHLFPVDGRAGNVFRTPIIERAIDQGLLTIEAAKPYMATGFESDKHIHKATRNHTNTRIDRFFMRVIALEPEYA